MNEIQSIDTLTTEILILKQQTAQNIIEIGKRLISVKESLPHGEWGKWLEEKVQFKKSTANNFMRVANEFSNLQTFGDLNQSKIFALLDVPTEEREEFVSKPHEVNGQAKMVDEMTTRELQQAIKEKQALEKKLKDAEERIEKSNTKLSKVETEKNKIKEKLDSIEGKNKEELVNKEVEIENLKLFVSDIEKKLAEAKASGNDEEAERLQASLSEKENLLFEANNKIKELEEQLKEKPIDVKETIVEKIPEEIEKELQELREKVGQASSGNEPTIKFSIYFQELVKGFKELLGTLSEIEDIETHTKYKNAVSGLINKMLDTL